MAIETMDNGLLKQPGSIFERWAESGGTFLSQVREQVTAPEQTKKMRRWGIQEAARLIGRTPQTVRSAEANDPRFSTLPFGPVSRDSAGHREYTLERINRYRDLFETRRRRPPGSTCIRCAVTNFKGGAGKTTTAVHLAQRCALEGLRVLMIDLDPQATTTLFFGLIPDVHVEREQTVGDILVDNPTMLRTAIQPSYFPGVDLIAANLTLQDAELQLGNPLVNQEKITGLNPIQRLDVAIQSVEDEYDVVILDCGPNLGILTLNAVYAANGLLIPMQPAMADFGSAVSFCQTMATLLSNPRFAKPLEFVRILVTRHTGTKQAKQSEAMIRLAFDPNVLDPVMVQTTEIERSANEFGTFYDFEKPRGSPEGHQRALLAMEAVNGAMLEVFSNVWSEQAVRNG